MRKFSMNKIQFIIIFITLTILSLHYQLFYPFLAHAKTSVKKTMKQDFYAQIQGNTVETVEPKKSELQPKHPTDASFMSHSKNNSNIGQQDLVLYFDFLKPPKNSKIEDLSGNGNHAKIHGPTWRKDAGIYFSGDNQYLEIKDAPSLEFGQGFSIAGEFMPMSYDEKPLHSILWKGNDPNNTEISRNSDYAIWINSDGNLYFSIACNDQTDSENFLLYTPGGSIIRRTFFTTVFDIIQRKMKIYLNGYLAAETEISDSDIFHSNASMIIGGVPGSFENRFFIGYMKSLRIFSRALTDSEIIYLTKKRGEPLPQPLCDMNIPFDISFLGKKAAVKPMNDYELLKRLDFSILAPGIDVQDLIYAPPGGESPTEIIYRHDGSPIMLSGFVMIFDCLKYCGKYGSARFFITADGNELWRSGTIKQDAPMKSFSVNLTGIKCLKLVTTDGGDGPVEDWAAWLNLKLTASDRTLYTLADTDIHTPVSIPPSSDIISDSSLLMTKKNIPLTNQSIEMKMPEFSPSSDAVIHGISYEEKIEEIYTLIEKPSGPNPMSIDQFDLSVNHIYIWIVYSKLKPGSILKGVWIDEGRNLILQEFPVIITQESGNTGLFIRCPKDGWICGKYRVDFKSGGFTIGTARFQIIE